MTADLDLIRRAANQMRELAEGVTPGAQWTGGNYWITDYDPSDPSGQAPMQRLIGGMDDGDAKHYARWDPVTALAVARLVDKVLAAHDLGLCICDTDHEALAVARAFLKEDADV